MTGSSETTTDRTVIQQWVEERGGRPVSVKGTGGDDDAGLLRIDFPDSDDDEPFEEITWDEFFEKFEEKQLAFLYQDTKKDGEQSYFSKLVSRD